jgi:hypothetical protein
MTDTVSLSFTNDEALVLFEWLAARWEAQMKLNPNDQSPLNAEEIVLARLQGQLERVLTETFDPAYKDLLAAARLRIGQP